VAFEDLDPARRRAPRPERGVLWDVHTALARPVARLVGLLGIAPGQLSLQSLTVTVVGLLRLASGDWAHVAQGALIVYGGFLLDRADWVLAQEKGRPSAWPAFLGLLVDRIVDALMVVALAILLAVGVHGQPSGLPPAFAPLSQSGAFVLAAGTLASLLLVRLVGAYADVLYLRTHLLVIRRLPGPSAISRRPQGVERLNRIFDRDLLVLAWVVGVALAQVQLLLWAVLIVHVLALAESVVLFWHRRKDPEPQASRILGQDYP
jgi:phosphatidylglycerophosphate synthase